MFRESGFFAKEPVDFGGVEISPREFTSRILFPLWQLREDQDDFTVMRIEFKENGIKTLEFNMYDERDKGTGLTSMARVTGFTCSAVARLILEGKFKKKGIYNSPPGAVI